MRLPLSSAKGVVRLPLSSAKGVVRLPLVPRVL